MAGTPSDNNFPNDSDEARYYGPLSSWIRKVIRTPLMRALIILIYARYSTEEQDQSSIESQVDLLRRLIQELGLDDVEIRVVTDAELSGELRHRPGIDAVQSAIMNRSCDLILCEDASRLYRNELFAFELVGDAVDQQMRVICLKDQVDTADPEDTWQSRLHDAMKVHAAANQFTSQRIRRKHDWIWKNGAALGPVRPGYSRSRKMIPIGETGREVEASFDAIVDHWASFIHEAYEMISAGFPSWEVAEFLTRNEVPKTSNALSPIWTAKCVNAMIRRTVYRGVETYRQTVSKRRYRKGGRQQQRNPKKDQLRRPMPHLRIVSDILWDAANAALDARNRNPNAKAGAESSMSGIPRDSRGPLSRLFVCGICGATMHRGAGRIGKGYACGGVKRKACWNRATSLIDLTHARVFEAVSERLRNIGPEITSFLERLHEHAGDVQSRNEHYDTLRKEYREEKRGIAKLVKKFENMKDVPISLMARMREREVHLRTLRKQLRKFRLIEANLATLTVPHFEAKVENIIERIGPMDRHAGAALRQIIRRVSAVPCQQFGSRKVVLRARIEIDLRCLLTFECRPTLDLLRINLDNSDFSPIVVWVDLFDPSGVPRHAWPALALKKQNLTLKQIAKVLGTTKRLAHLAVHYAKQLEEAGLADPFIELTECPVSASRWGKRKRKKND